MSVPWVHVGALAGHAMGAGQFVALDPAEIRHAAGARRLRDGDEVLLFDGHGLTAAARLAEHGRGCILLSTARQQPPEPHVTIAAAVPKGDRSAVMVDMATQLGMRAFLPLRCQRSVVEASGALIERLRRVALEACKQSHRAHMPEILPERALPALLAAPLAGSEEAASRLLLADPAGTPIRRARAQAERSDPEGVLRWIVLIGPEGGFTAEESQQARAAGALAVSLGDGILRIETAAVAAMQALRGAPDEG
jgi:16S rRNA (uracil1498-N3)-methyltransferase